MFYSASASASQKLCLSNLCGCFLWSKIYVRGNKVKFVAAELVKQNASRIFASIFVSKIVRMHTRKNICAAIKNWTHTRKNICTHLQLQKLCACSLYYKKEFLCSHHQCTAVASTSKIGTTMRKICLELHWKHQAWHNECDAGMKNNPTATLSNTTNISSRKTSCMLTLSREGGSQHTILFHSLQLFWSAWLYA